MKRLSPKKKFLASFALAAGLMGGMASSSLAMDAPEQGGDQDGDIQLDYSNGSPYFDIQALKEQEIVHVPTGIKVTKEQMIGTIANSQVIYIGETHDNMEAHAAQLDVIRALNEKFPGQIVVGMEMFDRIANMQLEKWNAGELSDEDFTTLYNENWGKADKVYYDPIFDYLRENNIPLRGLNISPLGIWAYKEGKRVPGDGFIPELDDTDEYHKAKAMAIFDAHPGFEQKQKDEIYKMMLLWDETMADMVAKFLDKPENKDKKLVVLAGENHIKYGYGIPKRAFRRHPHAYSTILPVETSVSQEMEGHLMSVKGVDVPLYMSHFVWRVPYVLAPDREPKPLPQKKAPAPN